MSQDYEFPAPLGPAQFLPSEVVLDALKVIFLNAPLQEILTSVTRLIEAQCEGILCSISLLEDDGLHLRYATPPNLSKVFQEATDGVRIGPDVGSYGTAAYFRRPVFVADIAADPKWTRLRNIALEGGVRAAWSSPILSHDGKLLGTFDMYCREARQPMPNEILLIEYASRIAGIAIERQQMQAAIKIAEEKTRNTETEIRQILDAIPQTIMVLSPEGNVLYANKGVLEYTGHSLEEAMQPDFRSKIFHPEDLERLRDLRRDSLARGLPFEYEERGLCKDGKYRWFLMRFSPYRDEQGRILCWYATGTDIDDRKRAEQKVCNENLVLREEIDRSSMFEAIVGTSSALRVVISQIGKVAPTDSTVLISGETGTGKELIASAIHKRSKRSAGPFIRVNCAAIAPSLLASELFGHEKGAFTGALQQRVGRFEAADGGTILLDEIGELSPETQIALLRVLQERELERVGSNRAISIDVRVIAATNRNLEEAVNAGKFRRDLFYRLNVFPIYVPPLRERKEDIPLLAEYFVDRFAKRARKKVSQIEKKSLKLLQAYDWPGNIRELQNVIERAVILSDDETLTIAETWLPQKLNNLPDQPGFSVNVLAEEKRLFADRERKVIEAALAECRGRVSGPRGAAAMLGIPHQTLESKIASHGIDKRRYKV